MKYSNLEPTPKRIVKPLERSSSNDFLRQIEVLDSSHLTSSLIKILESTNTILYNSKEMIDIVTYECILTEFLQRNTDLINTKLKWIKYRLQMEDNDYDINKITKR